MRVPLGGRLLPGCRGVSGRALSHPRQPALWIMVNRVEFALELFGHDIACVKITFECSARVLVLQRNFP